MKGSLLPYSEPLLGLQLIPVGTRGPVITHLRGLEQCPDQSCGRGGPLLFPSLMMPVVETWFKYM